MNMERPAHHRSIDRRRVFVAAAGLALATALAVTGLAGTAQADPAVAEVRASFVIVGQAPAADGTWEVTARTTLVNVSAIPLTGLEVTLLRTMPLPILPEPEAFYAVSGLAAGASLTQDWILRALSEPKEGFGFSHVIGYGQAVDAAGGAVQVVVVSQPEG